MGAFEKASPSPPQRKPQIDVQHLRAFDSILRLASLTRAADALGLTQSALSKSLGALRAHFDDPLFVRTPRGMEPTPRAQALTSAVQQALHVFDDELRSPPRFDPAVSDRFFSLLCSDFGALYFLPHLLAHTATSAPNVKFGVMSPRRVDIAAALASGEADLTLGSYPQLGAGIYQQVLYSDDYICLVRADHPRIGETLDLERYLSERHVVVSATGHVHSEVERRILGSCDPGRIGARVQVFMAAPFVVRATDLIATIPRRSAQGFLALGNLRVLPCPLELPQMQIRHYWHERFHHDPANRWLRSLTFTLFGEGAAAEPTLSS